MSQLAEKDIICEFMEHDQLVMTIGNYRYGGGVFCFIDDVDSSARLADSFDTCNGEAEYEAWGLGELWYPIAFGDTPEHAMQHLRRRLETTREYWPEVLFGIEALNVSRVFPQSGVSCQVKTIAQLKEARRIWNEGGEAIQFIL